MSNVLNLFLYYRCINFLIVNLSVFKSHFFFIGKITFINLWNINRLNSSLTCWYFALRSKRTHLFVCLCAASLECFQIFMVSSIGFLFVFGVFMDSSIRTIRYILCKCWTCNISTLIFILYMFRFIIVDDVGFIGMLWQLHVPFMWVMEAGVWLIFYAYITLYFFAYITSSVYFPFCVVQQCHLFKQSDRESEEDPLRQWHRAPESGPCFF